MLDLEDMDCLALDWRNNENSPYHCSIVERTLELSPADSGDADDADADPNKVTLQCCLEQFMQSEVLGHEEAWYCPKSVTIDGIYQLIIF